MCPARPGTASPATPSHPQLGDCRQGPGPCHLGPAAEWPGSAPGPTTGSRSLLLVQPTVRLRWGERSAPAPSRPASPQPFLISRAQAEQATHCLGPSLAPEYPQHQAKPRGPACGTTAARAAIPPPHAFATQPLGRDSAQTHLLGGPQPSRAPPPAPGSPLPYLAQAPWILPPPPKPPAQKAPGPSGHQWAPWRVPAHNQDPSP